MVKKRCMVLRKEKGQVKNAELRDGLIIIICESLENGWRFAHSVEKQEHTLGNSHFEAFVVLEEDFDRGMLKPVKPPKDFVFETQSCKEPVVKPEQPPQKVELAQRTIGSRKEKSNPAV